MHYYSDMPPFGYYCTRVYSAEWRLFDLVDISLTTSLLRLFTHRDIMFSYYYRLCKQEAGLHAFSIRKFGWHISFDYFYYSVVLVHAHMILNTEV